MGLADMGNPSSYLNSYQTTYHYTSTRDLANTDYNNTHFLPYQPIGARMYTSKAHRRGNLVKKVCDGSSNAYVATEYDYNIYEKDDNPILTTDAFTVCNFTDVPDYTMYGGNDYSIGTYTLIPYNKTPKYVSHIQQDGANITQTYEYFYDEYTDALDWNLPKSMSVSDSEYSDSKTYYTYQQGPQYYLPQPETEVTVRNEAVVAATRTEYDSNTRLPLRKYRLSRKATAKQLVSGNQATTAVQKQAINDLTYEYRYNSAGNLIQISYRGRPLASYLWGYNGLYPVIEVTGVAFEALGVGADNYVSSASITSLTKQLRTKFPKSNVTAIRYHWLFGIAELDGPRGDTSSYSYDSRGRLIEVRDFNKYLINKYYYQYDNPGWK